MATGEAADHEQLTGTISGLSAAVGAASSLGLTVLYALIVGGASRSLTHLLDQAQADWYLLAPLILGFGVQAALIFELRRRHRLMRVQATAGGAGAGASTAGMIACCAHHAADLAPFLGAAGAATFLTEYRLPFIFAGLGITLIGIVVSARRLARVVRLTREEMTACAA